MNITKFSITLLCVIAIGTTWYSISRTKEANRMIQILDQKDKLISDGYDEVIVKMLNEIKSQNIELARSQGRLEGIILTAQKLSPDDSEASGIWHAGYNRGLEQKKYTAEMYKNSDSPFKSQKARRAK